MNKIKSSKKTELLLVEDEVLIAMQEKFELEKLGYNVETISNGLEVVDNIEKNPNKYDLILMDINLGKGIYGTDIAKEILSKRYIPIVFLSSHTDPVIVQMTEEITSYGYVVKNSGPTVLDASIKMALKLFDSNRMLRESENKFKSIVENSDPVIFAIDKEGIFELSEGKCLSALGLEPGQVLGMSAYEVYKDYPKIIDGIKGALKGKTENDVIEVKGYKFKIFYSPWIGLDDEIIGVVGMAILQN